VIWFIIHIISIDFATGFYLRKCKSCKSAKLTGLSDTVLQLVQDGSEFAQERRCFRHVSSITVKPAISRWKPSTCLTCLTCPKHLKHVVVRHRTAKPLTTYVHGAVCHAGHARLRKITVFLWTSCVPNAVTLSPWGWTIWAKHYEVLRLIDLNDLNVFCSAPSNTKYDMDC
jgi:hypothetical protein